MWVKRHVKGLRQSHISSVTETAISAAFGAMASDKARPYGDNKIMPTVYLFFQHGLCVVALVGDTDEALASSH